MSRAGLRSRSVAAVLALLAWISLGGLPHFFSRKAQPQKPPGQQDVWIRYELDAVETGLPVTITQVGPNGVELRQYEPTPGRPRSSVIPGTQGAAAWHAALNYDYRARATLEVAAPPGAAVASATLRLTIEGQSNEAMPPRPPKTYTGLLAQALAHPFHRVADRRAAPALLSDETWALSVPRTELQRALDEVGMRGFFDRKTRPAGRASLSLTIDQQSQTKVWDRVHTLDALMERVRKQGRLAAHRGPDAQGRNLQSALPRVEILPPEVPVAGPATERSGRVRRPVNQPRAVQINPAPSGNPPPDPSPPADSPDDGPLLVPPAKE